MSRTVRRYIFEVHESPPPHLWCSVMAAHADSGGVNTAYGRVTKTISFWKHTYVYACRFCFICFLIYTQWTWSFSHRPLGPDRPTAGSATPARAERGRALRRDSPEAGTKATSTPGSRRKWGQARQARSYHRNGAFQQTLHFKTSRQSKTARKTGWESSTELNWGKQKPRLLQKWNITIVPRNGYFPTI